MAVRAKQLSAEAVMDGLKDLGARAAELGLIPQDGGKISARGEFIVAESNIEEDTNKKMRSYRYQPFPKTVHAWGPLGDGEGPLDLIVKNAAELDNAIKAGWSVDPVHGPGGRIVGGAVVAAVEEEVKVREFAAPGQVQPHDVQARTGKTKAKAAKKK